jgi:hypothetical protein
LGRGRYGLTSSSSRQFFIYGLTDIVREPVVI